MKKRIICLFLTLAVAISVCCSLTLSADAAAPADSGTCGDNLTWKLTNDGTLTISGTGEMDDYYYGAPWYEKRESISTVIIENGVTSIGEYAFNRCTELTSVTIGNSVTSLVEGAFWGCTGLTSVTIPGSVESIGNYVFSTCSGLTSVTIGNGVTSIGKSAFHSCSGLTSVTIPGSVESIGSYAFSRCTGLTSATIPDSVTSVGEGAFAGCSGITELLVDKGNKVYHSTGNCIIETESKTLIQGCKTSKIPTDGSVTSIGEYAFYNSDGLTSVTIPDNVTSIGKGAFAGCDSLTELLVDKGNKVYHSAGNCIIETESKTLIQGCKTSKIPTDGSVTSIGESAFEYCDGLTSITIPDSVTSIGEGSFANCTGLTSITIPDNVKSIGDGAFYSCTGLTSVTIGNGVASIDKEAFHGCSGLTNVTIGNGVTNIGDQAFVGCSGLTSITIPDSVTSIGMNAFGGCTGLTSVTIGNGVTNIGDQAFSNCDGLTSVTIPDSVERIGLYAFWYCDGLKSVTIGKGVTYIGAWSFWYCYNLTELLVDKENKVYHSADNCIIETESKTLIQGCKTSKIPTDGSVTCISDYAFNACTGLTSVTIPECVTSFGWSALGGCSNLETIYFTGTEEQWNAIEKNNSWDEFAGSETAKGKYTLIFNADPSGIRYDGDYIYGIAPGTTVDELKKEDIVVKDAKNGIVGTGTKVVVDGKEYTVVIKGDIDGDGNINATDYLKVRLHILKRIQLKDSNLLAAHVSTKIEKPVSAADYTAIRLHILKKKLIVQ